MLTVAIPTFNRNHLLLACVERLLPQLGECELLIIDNCSDTPVETTLGPWLERLGTAKVRIVRVPGAFEIPAAAAKLAHKARYSAIICFGVIFQGETSHAQHIGWGVTHAFRAVSTLRTLKRC